MHYETWYCIYANKDICFIHYRLLEDLGQGHAHAPEQGVAHCREIALSPELELQGILNGFVK